MIEQWLTKTAVYVRAYLYPSVGSINIHNQDEDTTQEFEIPDQLSQSLLAEIIPQEELTNDKSKLSQINQVLVSAFHSLMLNLRRFFSFTTNRA